MAVSLINVSCKSIMISVVFRMIRLMKIIIYEEFIF